MNQNNPPGSAARSPDHSSAGISEALQRLDEIADCHIVDGTPVDAYDRFKLNYGDLRAIRDHLRHLAQSAAKPMAYWVEHPKFGMELSLDPPNEDSVQRGWVATPLYAAPPTREGGEWLYEATKAPHYELYWRNDEGKVFVGNIWDQELADEIVKRCNAFAQPDATPAGAVVAATSGVTAGETALQCSSADTEDRS